MTRSNTTRGLRPLLVAGLVAGPMTSLADAGLTFTLDPGQNIQAAINGAADGDEIVLNPGTYEQLFTIDRSLTIRSIDPSDPGTVAATVIDGVLLDSVVQIVGAAASGSSLEGLTITGGDAVEGGGVRLDGAGTISISNCVIEFNTAVNPGGGIYAAGTNTNVTATTFRGNSVTATGSDGAGMFATTGTHVFRACTFVDGTALDTAGGLRLDNAVGQIVDSVFDNNECGLNGGAIFIRSGTVLTIDGTVFRNNTAMSGGAVQVYSDTGTIATMRNCVFQGNSASSAGGALYNRRTMNVVNCTFEGSVPDGIGGTGSPVTTVSNSILWNNGASPITVPGTRTVRWSTVEGGYTGTGNRADDPTFVNAAAGDLRLSAGSPAIDAGDTGLYCGPLVDHDGNTRGVDAPSVDTGLALTGPVVDMGAYEFQIGVVASGCASDINDDASVGFADLTKLLADWGACP